MPDYPSTAMGYGASRDSGLAEGGDGLAERGGDRSDLDLTEGLVH